MSNPEFIIKLTDRTANGALKTESILKIRNILENRGAILLPSDTCYSLAVLPIDKDMMQLVRTILDREDHPISLAFPNFEIIKQYLEINTTSAKLFEQFTPGCITVVCKAKEKSFADITLTQDGTIGVRLTDCEIERTVAGCTNYPITTTPPKYNNNVIREFDIACKIIQEGIRKLRNPILWAAIETDRFYSETSTVVTVTSDGRLLCNRDGEIPYDYIQSSIESY